MKSENYRHSVALRALLLALRPFQDDEPIFNRKIQDLSNDLYYGLTIKNDYSGLRTESSIETNEKVKEHPVGRYEATVKLYELAITNVSDDEFYLTWTKYRKYNLTTKAENQQLKVYHSQNEKSTPKQAYDAVCSPLVEWFYPSQRKT